MHGWSGVQQASTRGGYWSDGSTRVPEYQITMHEANPWTAAHCIRIWGPIKKIRGSLQGRSNNEVGPSSISFRSRRDHARARASFPSESPHASRPRRTDDPIKLLTVVHQRACGVTRYLPKRGRAFFQSRFTEQMKLKFRLSPTHITHFCSPRPSTCE